MKKASHLLAAGAAIAFLPLAVFAQQTPTTPDEQPAQSQGATFESLDTDGDGRISRTEAAANAGVSEQFSAYDLNGDGFIERAEVNQANSPRSDTPPRQ